MADSSDEDLNSDNEFIDLDALRRGFSSLRMSSRAPREPEPTNNSQNDNASRDIILFPINEELEFINPPEAGDSASVSTINPDESGRRGTAADNEIDIFDVRNIPPISQSNTFGAASRSGEVQPSSSNDRPFRRGGLYRIPQRRNVTARRIRGRQFSDGNNPPTVPPPDFDNNDTDTGIPTSGFVLPAALKAAEEPYPTLTEDQITRRCEFVTEFLMTSGTVRKKPEQKKDISASVCPTCGQTIKKKESEKSEDEDPKKDE